MNITDDAWFGKTNDPRVHLAQGTDVRQKVMQRFAAPYDPFANLFVNCRYNVNAATKRTLRQHAFQAWTIATEAELLAAYIRAQTPVCR